MTRSCFANMREYLAVGLAVVGVTGCTSFAVSRANIDASSEWSTHYSGRGDRLIHKDVDIYVRAGNLVQYGNSEAGIRPFGISLYFVPHSDGWAFDPGKALLEMPGTVMAPTEIRVKRAGYGSGLRDCSGYADVPQSPDGRYQLFGGFCTDLFFPIEAPSPDTTFSLRIPPIQGSSREIVVPTIRLERGDGAFRLF